MALVFNFERMPHFKAPFATLVRAPVTAPDAEDVIVPATLPIAAS